MKQWKKVFSKAQPLAQMTEIEMKELWEQARLTNGVIVEIGTYLGGSAVILESGGAKVHTIDIQPCEEIKGTSFVKIIGESLIIARTWMEPIDLLFIDGDHHYESIKEDLKAWMPHVKLKGKIIFHDYDSHVGVTLAVHRAIEDKFIEPIKKAGSLLVTIRNN